LVAVNASESRQRMATHGESIDVRYALAMTTTPTGRSGNVLAALGIAEPDIEAAKADLAARIHRLLEYRRVWPQEAAAILRVSESELPALLRGRLATCSLDQLVRVVTWLGDDVEILIRPKPRGPKRGVVRVFKADAVERAYHHAEPSRQGGIKRTTSRSPSSESRQTDDVHPRVRAVNERKLLDKWKVEEMTSLDITTIYRKIKAGTFPKPVRIGRRRVAWRELDIAAWLAGLEVGTRL
jgi:prophage regulatory protein